MGFKIMDLPSDELLSFFGLGGSAFGVGLEEAYAAVIGYSDVEWNRRPRCEISATGD